MQTMVMTISAANKTNKIVNVLIEIQLGVLCGAGDMECDVVVDTTVVESDQMGDGGDGDVVVWIFGMLG